MGKSKREQASLKKKMNTYSPIQIKEGEILTDVTANKWRVGKTLGAGGFGEIYLVSDNISKSVSQDALFVAKIEPHKNGPLFVEMNCYIRVAKKEMIDQWKKEKGLKHLGMPHYITFGSHLYQNEKFRFLILKRFGQDLSKLFHKCKKKFHIKTVLTLGIQILDILEYIHSHGYIHADIKDSNLLLGAGKDEDNVYLLDYGLACRYVDSYGAHKDYNPDQRKAHDGTLQYTSRDAHVGAHSRRSDLEGLAYNMIHWLSGSLPWSNELSDPEKVAQEKENYMSNIPCFLKKCFGVDPPVVLNHFLKYVVSLNFDTKPDYKYCKTLLRQGIRQAGYADDGKLNFNSSPAKLKSLKRVRNSDIENWIELKPVKIPRNASRQPCVPVQANFNRMTRQQTAASSLALRSKETFDWVKVLQSNPDKILKSPCTSNDQTKKKRNAKGEKEKSKCETLQLKPKKEKENALDNPTPAILEVLKLRNSCAASNLGRRIRTDSSCCSPVFYDHSTLTPAMEEIIRRREAKSQKDERNDVQFSSTIPSSISPRSSRLENRNKNRARNSDSSEIKRAAKKTSVPETKPSDMRRRLRTRNNSIVPEQKLTRDSSPSDSGKRKNIRKDSPKTKKMIGQCRKRPLTLTKSSNRKMVGFSTKKTKEIREREVSPSEIVLIPRLRSGFDQSKNFLINKIINSSTSSSNPKIRNYAANSSSCSSSPNRRKKCGINCSRLSPSSRDSSSLLL